MVRFTDRSHPSGEFRERRLRVAIVGTDENALMAAALWMHQGAEFVGLCCLPPENSPDPALLPTLMTPAARMRRPSLAASALPAWGSENPETEEPQQQQSLPPRYGGKSEASPSSSTSASPSAAAAAAQGAAPLDVRHWTGPENLEGTPVTFHTGGSGGGFGGIRVVTPIGSWVERPHMIGLDNEAEIIEQADVVLLMGPPASQQRLLRVVGRHLRPGQALGAIPGGGGFGWKAGRFLQSQVRQGVALFALPVCPWRCRTTAGGEGAEFLATVELLGTSEHEFITFARDVGASDRADILRVLSQLFLTTRFRDGGDMLIASLHPFTTILIPGILYSFYRRSHQDLPNNENDVEPEASGDNFQPFQYFSEIDQYTVDILNQLDQELQQVKKGLEVYFKGHVDLSCFQSLEEYLSQAYHEQIEDHSSLLSIFRTNSAFRNLEIPYLTIRCEEVPKQPVTSSSASDNSSASRVIRKVVDSPMMRRTRPQHRTRPSSSSSASAVPVPVPPPPATSANNALFALPAQENSSSSSSSTSSDSGIGSGASDKRERRSSVGGMARDDGNEDDEGRRNERLLRQFRNELAHGLLVAKAVADLVGVEVPGMVRILQAAQEDPLRMRILSEDAQLAGPDVGLSGCPQRFGIGSPSELIV